MEKLPLRAQPLHNVHSLLTEEANVAAANVNRELFSERALWKESTESIFRGQREKYVNGEKRLKYIKDLVDIIKPSLHQATLVVCWVLSFFIT